MRSIRAFIVLLGILVLAGSVFAAEPQIGFKDLMLSAERDFKQIHEARNAALALDQPTTIYLPEESIMIDALGVEDDVPVYAVITNLVHPFEGGYTAFYDQIRNQFDLSNARIHFGANKVTNPDLGFPTTRNVAPGDSLLLIPDWTNDRVMAFDYASGDLFDADFIPSNSTLLSSPKEAQLSPWGTITVSDQIEDVVQEFDTSGSHIQILAPTGGPNPGIMDNIRGHAYRPNGNLVVATFQGTNANAVVEFDQGGNYLGNFIAAGSGGLASPFGIWFRASDVLVSGSSSGAVHQYDLDGNYIGNFASISSFPQQVVELPDGNIAVANFQGTGQTGVRIYSPTGQFIRLLSGVTGNRGVWQLGNGNILTTTGTGVYEIDYITGSLLRTVISGASSQFINLYVRSSGVVADSGVFYASTGINDGGRFLTIDKTTGSGTLIGLTGLFAVPALAINSSGEIFGTDGSMLYSIDAVTGQASFQANTGLAFLPAIAFDANDVLYGLGIDTVNFAWNLFTINTTTGTATLVGPALGADWRGMAFDPTDGNLWASTNSTEIFAINPSTGEAHFVGNTGLGVGTPDIAFDDMGNLYGAVGGGAASNDYISIDKTTGAGTVIGPIGFSAVSGMAVRNTFSLSGPQIGIFPPGDINFGKVGVGTSLTLSVTIRSVGTADLTVSGITNPAAPFALVGVPSLPVVISPGGSETFDISFMPANDGIFNAMITISSDDPNDPTKNITLSGEGVLPPPIGTLFGSDPRTEVLIIIDPATGSGTLVGSTFGFGGITEIEFRDDGVLFASTGGGESTILTINLFSGQPTLLGQHDFGAVNGLEFSPGGTLFGTYIPGPGEPSELVIVDQLDGSLTYIGPTGFSNIGGLAFSSGGALYGVTSGDTTGYLVSIDTTTGVATMIGSTGFEKVGSLEFSPSGTLYAGLGGDMPDSASVITIDPATGAGTLVGASGFSSISGLSFFPGYPVSIDDGIPGSVPMDFELSQNYPNPFNPTTSIRYQLPVGTKVDITIYNLLGQKVRTLINEFKQAGGYEIEWDGFNDAGHPVASGVYLYRIQTDDFVGSKKMILLK